MPRKKKNKAAENRQFDFVILDGSGSMSGVQTDVVGGINQLIEEGTKLDPDDRFWLTVFSGAGQINKVYENVRFGDVKPVTRKETYIGQNTAYLDAVGITLSEIEKLNLEGKKVVTIYTDGLENASREYTKAQVKALIERLQSLGDWTFVFLSADLDQTNEATSIGIPLGNIMKVNSATTDSNFAALTQTRGAHKVSNVSASASYLADHDYEGAVLRAEQEKKKTVKR